MSAYDATITGAKNANLTAPPDRLERHLAIRVKVVRSIEVDWVKLAARDERLQVNHLGAFQIEGF